MELITLKHINTHSFNKLVQQANHDEDVENQDLSPSFTPRKKVLSDENWDREVGYPFAELYRKMGLC